MPILFLNTENFYLTILGDNQHSKNEEKTMLTCKTRLLTLATIALSTACGGAEHTETEDQKVASSTAERLKICTLDEQRTILDTSRILGTSLLGTQIILRKELRLAVEELNPNEAKQAGSTLRKVKSSIDVLLNSGILQQINCRLTAANTEPFDVDTRLSELNDLAKELQIHLIFSDSLKDQVAKTIEEGQKKIRAMAEQGNIAARDMRKILIKTTIETFLL